MSECSRRGFVTMAGAAALALKLPKMGHATDQLAELGLRRLPAAVPTFEITAMPGPSICRMLNETDAQFLSRILRFAQKVEVMPPATPILAEPAKA